MATSNPLKNRLQKLKNEYDSLKKNKESLLVMLDEAEAPEGVYNSNAIENSSLTLKETEKILLDMEISREFNLREAYEAKNLARVMAYTRTKSQETEVTRELILLLHQMLIGVINDKIAGRFRQPGEYVRVGSYVAPAPEKIEGLMADLLKNYLSDHLTYFLEKIARFHLDFEDLHPFCDGNGRIGRVLINFQLQRLGFPRIIIRDKEKQKYYQTFTDYRTNKNTKLIEEVVFLGLMEALNKRVTYLKGEKIINLADCAKKINRSSAALINAARRQNIPAFREKGVWKIGEEFKL
jgi:Fic family protein